MKVARALVGVLVSVVFAWLTLSRVDLSDAVGALGRAAPLGLLLVFGFGWLEIAVRAWRWRFLLSSIGRVEYDRALAYTCVGYFANTLLPMRLGEFARAYLASGALRLPALATLGSILTERVMDGAVILAVATGLGFVVIGASDQAPLTLWVALGLAGLVVGLLAVVVAARYKSVIAKKLPVRVREPVARLWAGAVAIRNPRGMAVATGATLTAYLCAVASMLSVAWAMGLSLTPLQAGFAIAWIGLSTAIPAAPGSVGTYEFVGVSVLTMLGQDPATSLAAVLLLHVLGMLPVALAGLALTWGLHLRVWRLAARPGDGAELLSQAS